MPSRVPVGELVAGTVVKLAAERKLLTNLLKIAVALACGAAAFAKGPLTAPPGPHAANGLSPGGGGCRVSRDRSQSISQA